jgi:hypothetical protein
MTAMGGSLWFCGEQCGDGGSLFCDICVYANVYISILGGKGDFGVGGMLLALRVTSGGWSCLLLARTSAKPIEF